MDGYSVHDAAAVLGIPETRVWELIARGVLSGAPEADGGMRVFLKQPVSAPAADAPPTNGNGGAHDVEMSPFRELLTEFRNLTERYGQALLALGESRGEVAALRSRVDLLEARIDLRLPGMRPVSTVAWEVPEQETRPAEERAGGADEAVAEAPEVPPSHDEERREAVAAEPARTTPRRRRSARTTPAAFAEALARAQDPTLPELPGAREAAAALAALQDLPAAEGLADVAAEPPVEAMPEPVVAAAVETHPVDLAPGTEEEPVAGPEPAAAEPAEEAPGPTSIYSTELVEPDWFADGDFSWLEQAAAAAAEPDAEQPAPAPEIVEEAAAVAAAEDLSAAFDTIDVPVEQPAPEPGLWVADAEPGANWASLASEPAPEIPAETGGESPQPEIEPGASAANLGGDEVPLMWLGDEFSAAELEFAAPGWGGSAPDAVPPPKPIEWVARDAPAPRSSRPPAPGDADWLRGRRGPAATAYRRLRRLFPG